MPVLVCRQIFTDNTPELVQTQLVGSIQMTNDLDVHIALLQAPSYQKQMVSLSLTT